MKCFFYLFVLLQLLLVSCGEKETASSFISGEEAKYYILKGKMDDAAIIEFLQNNEWGPDYGYAGDTLTFQKNMTVKASSNYEGANLFEAAYDVIDSDIIMTISKQEIIFSPPKIVKFKIVEDEGSLKYSQCLRSFEGSTYVKKIWNKNSINSKKDIYVDGLNIVVDRKTAKISEKTKYYEYPKKRSRTYMVFDYENNYETESLPKRLIDYSDKLEIIGYNIDRPEWFLAFKPIYYGSYDKMLIKNEDEMKNYCWVKISEISF